MSLIYHKDIDVFEKINEHFLELMFYEEGWYLDSEHVAFIEAKHNNAKLLQGSQKES